MLHGINSAAWQSVLTTASKYGWRASGTTPPPDYRDWDGSYTSNDGQCVGRADAVAMADALYLAILDVHMNAELDKHGSVCPFQTHEFPGSEHVGLLKDFIGFCRGGCFWIC